MSLATRLRAAAAAPVDGLLVVNGLLSPRQFAGHQRHDDTYDTTPTTSSTITAHATPHTKGTAVDVIAANLSDTDRLLLHVETGPSQSGVATGMLLDILLNDVVAIADINVGSHTDTDKRHLRFPLHVPRGVKVGARIQALIGGDTVAVRLHTEPGNGRYRGGRGCVTYGAATSTSTATAVPSGNNTWGAWTTIATTTRSHRWIVPSVGNSATGLSASPFWFQIGVGATPVIISRGYFRTNAAEAVNVRHVVPARRDLPSGSVLKVRAWAAGTTQTNDFCLHGFD